MTFDGAVESVHRSCSNPTPMGSANTPAPPPTSRTSTRCRFEEQAAILCSVIVSNDEALWQDSQFASVDDLSWRLAMDRGLCVVEAGEAEARIRCGEVRK